jgi:hypothetical protein
MGTRGGKFTREGRNEENDETPGRKSTRESRNEENDGNTRRKIHEGR